jgi:hypothetical protein
MRAWIVAGCVGLSSCFYDPSLQGGGSSTTGSPPLTTSAAPTTDLSSSTASASTSDSTSVSTVTSAGTTTGAHGETTAQVTMSDTAGSTTAGSSTDECVAAPWYLDADEDGYGDADALMYACEQPDGYVADATDCDDGDEGVSPGAIEVCDNRDNDCDDIIDEYSSLNTVCGGCGLVPDDPDMPTRAYYFCGSPIVWDKAKTLCEDRGAQLAGDEMVMEHEFLTTQLAAIDPESGGWWLGGFAPGIFGYEWLDGQTISGTDPRWDTPQPGSDPNKCVQLLSPDVVDGDHWTARACSESRPYVCEIAL